MEQREAGTLADDVARGPLSIADLLRRALDFATVLNQLHRQGQVHGGISPSIIAITPAGIQLLEPAPAATITAYTAPEQLSGRLDARSDIFAFGAVLYELCTGCKAFSAESEAELRAAILDTQPPPIPTVLPQAAAVPAYAMLEKLITTCLVKNPDRRRQRMQTVQVDLKLMLASVQRVVRPVAASAPAAAVAPVAPPAVEPVARSPKKPVVETGGPLGLPPVEPRTSSRPPLQAPRPAPYAPATPRLPARTGGMPAPVTREISGRAEASSGRSPKQEPGMAERRAAMILNHVGFGQEPAYMDHPPQNKWGFKLKVRTTQAQKGVWLSVLKIAATLVGAAVITVVVMAAKGSHLRLPILNNIGKPAGPVSRQFPVPAPDQASYMSSPAISPDGKLLVFSVVSPQKKRQLWIRPLTSLRATPLEGTDDAMAPFWSPDSAYIGFFSAKKLKKIAVSGGTPSTLCDTAGLAGGGAWNKDGVIIFGHSFFDALYRVSANGGTPESVTRLDSSRGETAHLWPRFLPDGRHFLLYALAGSKDDNGVSVGSLDNKETRHLLSSETNAIYAEAPAPALTRKGYLLFARGPHLLAQPFDASTAELQGDSYAVADDITYLKSISLLPMSASDNGLLAFQSIDAPKHQLVWFDRQGNQTGTLGEPGEYGHARISPDGRTVAMQRATPGIATADIWLVDLETGRTWQFTTSSAHEGSPVWSPDSKSIVYFSNPDGRYDIYFKSVAGGKEELLFSSKEDKEPTDWSADGRFLLFASMGPGTDSDLWVLPLKGERNPHTYLKTVSIEGFGAFSPDGKWIAYQSDETGRAEVYVEPFPRVQGQARRYQISTEGGGLPRWRQDGKELYYMMNNGGMMAVTVSAGAGFAISPPRLLFETRALPRTWNLYDVTRDGSRFLVSTPLEWASSSPITVISNWTEGFRVQ